MSVELVSALVEVTVDPSVINSVTIATERTKADGVLEVATGILTIDDILPNEQSTVTLFIYANKDGVAEITTDSPIIDFPSTVNVVKGKNQVSGLITRPGTCNVSVALEDDSDVTQFIIEDALSSEQSTVQLFICANRDGIAELSMDNPIVNFPPTVNVVEGGNQISGLIVGSGVCNVTVTLEGVSDVTRIIIKEIPTQIKAGPRQIYQVYLP